MTHTHTISGLLGSLLVTALLLAAPTLALDVNGGSLKSNDLTNCTANAGVDQSHNIGHEDLLVKTRVKIEEWSSKQDKWWAELKVTWQSWPDGAASPGNKDASRDFVDTQGNTDTWDIQLATEWDGIKFDRPGNYAATVRIEIQWFEKPWNSGSFDMKCNAIDTMNLTLTKQPSEECETVVNGQCVIVV